jgi:hypothetical protein
MVMTGIFAPLVCDLDLVNCGLNAPVRNRAAMPEILALCTNEEILRRVAVLGLSLRYAQVDRASGSDRSGQHAWTMQFAPTERTASGRTQCAIADVLPLIATIARGDCSRDFLEVASEESTGGDDWGARVCGNLSPVEHT